MHAGFHSGTFSGAGNPQFHKFVWSPFDSWLMRLIMAALRSRCGHYIFALLFLLSSSSSSFFSSPNLRGCRTDVYHTSCTSEICYTWLAGNAGPKKSQKIRHLSTIAQLCRTISSQLRHISTIGKKLLNSNISSTCPHNMVNFSPLAVEICWRVGGTPNKFQRVSRLGSVTARHSSLVVGVSQTLRRWTEPTEGDTYIRQVGHHFGHWPTFLVYFLTGCI